MRAAKKQQRQQAGSVLVITLVLMGILGITLGGYLYWARTQNLLVAQSQAWNSALALAEAGIEEAMAQVNVTFGTNYHSSATTNWGWSGAVYGPRTNALPGGSYSTIIIPGAPGPTIISTGYAVVPYIARPVQRVVRVTTTTSSTFGKAMVAMQDITFNGKNIYIDSFDSADPLHSLLGRYSYLLRKPGGDVATTYGTVNVNNADVKGKVRTGPQGSFNVGAKGSVGDLLFAGPGIQEGWSANDFNAEIKDVQLPNLTGFVEPSAIPGDTNKYVLGSANYIINGDLELKGETMLVNGNATLFVTGNVNMQGGSSVNPTEINIVSGRLSIYVAGASAVFTRVNTDGNASSFTYYGLPSNTSLIWNGNDAFVGSIYAPQATFICGGGGNNTFDYQGACVVKAVTMNGHFNFHYDENLRRTGMPSGYVVTSWAEL